jgi:TRAP-type C4-dicarboxylate transport system substrate-binding protein
MKFMMTFAAAIAAMGFCSAGQATPLAQQWLDGAVSPPPINIGYSGAPVVVRYSSFLAPQSPVAQIAIKAFQRLKDESGGKLVIQPFWSNTLANAQEGGYDAVASGVAQMGQCYSYMSPGGFTLQHGLELPGMFPSSSVGARAIMDVFPKYLRQRFEQHKVYFGRSSATPPQQILSRARPVNRLEDLAGKTILGVGEVPSSVARALGASPVPLAPGELYLSFQTGVVDYMVLHDAGAVTFRMTELAKYRTEANLSSHILEFCLNPAFFNALAPDLKAVFYRWMQLWNHAESELYFDIFAESGRASLRKAGAQFISLTPQEQTRWQAAYKPVEEAWVQKMEAAGEPARQFLADFRASVKQHAGASGDTIFRGLMDKPVPGLISGYTYPATAVRP